MTEVNNTENRKKIDAILADISQLPALPAVAHRALSMAYNPDVDIKKLAEEISHDPAITASVIKLANSPYFHSAKAVRSIPEAIMNLGLNSVKDIIIIAASRGMLKVNLESYKLEANQLWDHCLASAELSSRIAKLKKNTTKSDVAFTAGLLHDVGKIVLAHFFRPVYRVISMEMEQNPNSRFSDIEKKHLGYDHSEIGGRLLQIWKFPNELVEAVTFTYHPEMAKESPELCSIIHVANALTISSGVGVDIGGLNESISPFAIKTLNLTDSDLTHLYGDMPELLTSIEDMRAM